MKTQPSHKTILQNPQHIELENCAPVFEFHGLSSYVTNNYCRRKSPLGADMTSRLPLYTLSLTKRHAIKTTRRAESNIVFSQLARWARRFFKICPLFKERFLIPFSFQLSLLLFNLTFLNRWNQCHQETTYMSDRLPYNFLFRLSFEQTKPANNRDL